MTAPTINCFPLDPTCAAQKIAASAVQLAMDAIVKFFVDGAVWLLDQVGSFLTTSASVSLSSTWYVAHYRQMSAVAGSMAAVFLLVSAASVVVHRDPARLGRALVMVGYAGVGTGMVLGIAGLLLELSDSLSAWVAGGSRADLRGTLHGMGRSLAAVDPTEVGVVALLGAVLLIIGAVTVWLELLLRAAAIYACVLFFPLALAGLAWEGSRRWARRLAEALVALIFSKFVIVAVLSLAAGAIGSSAGFTAVLAGAALLLLATFAPFLLIKVIGVLEVAVNAAALEGTRQRATGSLTSGTQTVMRTALAGPAGFAGLAVSTGSRTSSHRPASAPPSAGLRAPGPQLPPPPVSGRAA